MDKPALLVVILLRQGERTLAMACLGRGGDGDAAGRNRRGQRMPAGESPDE